MSQAHQAVKPIADQNYSYLQALYKSFYSARLYIDVATRWRGVGLVYLMLVFAVLSIPLSIQFNKEIGQFYKTWLVGVIEVTPNIYIQQGQLVVDGPDPIEIKNANRQVVVMIDKHADYEKAVKDNPYLVFLFANDKLYYRMPLPQAFSGEDKPLFQDEPQIYDYDKHANEVFNPKQWLESSYLDNLQRYFILFIYPGLIFSLLGLYASIWLVVSMMAQLMARIIYKFKLTYKQTARLMAVASTPGLFVFFVIYMTYGTFTGLSYLVLSLIVGYYSFGALMVKHFTRQVVQQ